MEEDKKMEDFYTVKDGIATITNLPEFVKAGLSSGKLIAKKAKKVAPVIFEASTEEYVKKNGDGEQAQLESKFGEFVEAQYTVRLNHEKFIARGAKFGEIWQVNHSNYKKVNLTKEQILTNEDIDDTARANLIRALEEGKDIYMPNPDDRFAVAIEIQGAEEIRFQAPWNANEEYQTIRNGGYVVLGENDRISKCNKVNMFGNQQFTFKSSYKEEEGEYNQELIRLINQAQMEVLNKSSEDIKENPEDLEGGMQGAVTLKDSIVGSGDGILKTTISATAPGQIISALPKQKTSIWSKIVSKIKSFFGKEKNSDYIKTNEHYKKESEKRWKEELQNYKDEECDEKGNYLSIGQNRDEYLPNGMSKAAYIDAHEKGEEKF